MWWHVYGAPVPASAGVVERRSEEQGVFGSALSLFGQSELWCQAILGPAPVNPYTGTWDNGQPVKDPIHMPGNDDWSLDHRGSFDYEPTEEEIQMITPESWHGADCECDMHEPEGVSS